ncbi:VOC family protein [Asticcacaulis benevestitus]|uniref:VOC domain-containing protein n=1 Tax=Asticcacaulis benevestitus DSM 16100 = ATCC BAA-896 TaxID=1121022 RepID=V4NZ26_9CAUL|nr:VOC family protein [Asticcacaulis benevestitus]ESQ87022.1 hypothetical protein ABENE_17485 [Asticcacaulis benevestitus DSM 16100 = ATCC BAA-896]
MSSHFIWYELITSDIDVARAFYSEVIGWTVASSQTPGMDYRRIMAAGEGIGGMMTLPDPSMTPAWFGYVNVADVDAEVTAFETAGGRVLWPANDDAGVGRMAMVADPQGAALYVMSPNGEGESPAFKSGALGHCGWNEYHATDWEKAFDFYAGRFGWVKNEAIDMGLAGTYQTFTVDGIQTGGMMNNPIPQPVWLFYFNVPDIDVAMEALTQKGGAVQMPPMQVPGGQWALVARDPQGAMFGLLGSRTV